jgi:WD40 repeat protein
MERSAALPDGQPAEASQYPISTEFGARSSGDGSERPLGDALVLGDYILEEQIAHGGMGVIYRAFQVSLARTVAVKLLLLGRYSSPESISRFHREAQAAAVLRHPNIVSVFEVGECEGQPFLAMEYVEGPSLATVMKQGPLSPNRATEYVRSIAEALNYAHTRGVLHRDIKPSNVLVDIFDQVRLTDFGLAKKLDGSTDMTVTGQMIGTPNYLSPEQVAGKHAEIGPPSDIYGIGALLYELLTGRPPFMAQSLQDTLLHIRESEAVPPTALNPAVPRDLNTITLKCLEKVPARRYASAGELANDLGRFLRNEPISARPISLPERIWKSIRRNRVRAALIGTVVGSLLCLTGGSLLFGVRVNRAHAEIQAVNRRLAHDLFVREWNDAEQLVDAGKPGSALTWFARVVRQNPTNHVAATRLLGLLADQTFSLPAAPGLVHPAPVLSADFSPDGHHVVSGCADGKVRIWSWPDGTTPRILTNQFDGPGPAAAFMPDSGRILIADLRTISVWSMNGTFQSAVPVVHSGALRWTMVRDGKSAALVSSSAEPELWDTRTLRLVGPLNYGYPQALAAPISPDGRYVLRNNKPSDAPGLLEVGIWEVNSSRRVWHIRLRDSERFGDLYSGAISDDNRLVAFSRFGGQILVCPFQPRSEGEPDEPAQDPPLIDLKIGEGSQQVEDLRFFDRNRRLVIATTEGVVQVCDLQSGELLPSRIEHLGRVTGTCISPDGVKLATTSIDGTVRFWDLRPERPKPLIVNLSDDVWEVAFSPDSSWFVTSGNPNAEVHDSGTGALRYQLPMGSLVSCVRVSPDGRRIATCTEQGSLRVWDSATGAPITPLIRVIEHHQDLSFSSDGRWICVGAPSDQIWILETETGKPVFPPFVVNATVVRSAITPDLKTLISVTVQGEVYFWSLPDGQPRGEGRHKGVVWTARLSGNGAFLATASGDQTVRIWEVSSGKVLHEFRSEQAVYNAVFSPDARRLLIGSADRTARIIDIESGRQVSETMRHPGGVWFTQFSPDGRLVLTGDDSGAARLWDAQSGLPLSNWLRSRISLKCALFSPNGRSIVTSSRDHTVKLWPVIVAPPHSPSWLPDLAEAIVGRRLDDDGTIHEVPFDAFQALRDQLAASTGDGFYSRWAHWFFLGRDGAAPVQFVPP